VLPLRPEPYPSSAAQYTPKLVSRVLCARQVVTVNVRQF